MKDPIDIASNLFRTSRSLAVGACLLIAISLACAGAECRAQPVDIGSWDGALWRFVLTPQKGNPHKGTLVGRFRVQGLAIHQGENKDDNEMKKKVGESMPERSKRPTHTVVTLDDFRAVNRGGTWRSGISGTARLKRKTKDQNGGQFIDKEGYHWEMSCTRVQD